MRLTALAALVALGAAACGGGDKNANAAPAAATPAAATPAMTPSAAPAGPVVEVKMTGNGTSQAAFEPKTLTIAPGTTVRFVNVVGGPHNVSFFKDSIPAGAEVVLNAAMANRIDNLEGALLVNANDHYDVSFAGAPEGVYKGFCLPHQALGMRIAITVKK
ncbi:MAG TPA: plastocyanin/azurin family copper-binding protein [Gemmatimonadales bacterium]|jgi:plastocyanin|nr:plastocyanin/azurin family copper-binding protein [Gemmatimonadales bacterium]